MKQIYLLAAGAIILAACDNTADIPDTNMVPLTISASISGSVDSRAINDQWDKDDSIGISVTVGTLAATSFQPHVNLRYNKSDDSNVLFTGDPLYFYNHMHLTAYYPFTGTQGSAPGTDGGVLKVTTSAERQTTEEQAKYDFLYAHKSDIKVADCDHVELSFSHMMSKLTFAFVNSNDPNNKMDVSKIRIYSIEGLKMQGSFNTLTGDCCADADAQTDTLSIDTPEGTVKEKVPLQSLIVFPQIPEVPEIADPKPEEPDVNPTAAGDSDAPNLIKKARLHIYIDEAGDGDVNNYQHYYCTLSFGDESLKPGHHYSFTIFVTKVGLITGDMTITAWDDVNTTLAATIDGDIELPDE